MNSTCGARLSAGGREGEKGWAGGRKLGRAGPHEPIEIDRPVG
jgi:hypothetical protein